MSIEPEHMLEEALRGDLPTPHVEARLRRRLLAAGVAVGNGAAAATAGASGAGAGALAAKAAGLSWGLKLGLAAFVTIPTVGLWLEGRGEPGQVAPAVSANARDAATTPQLQTAPNARAAPGPGVDESPKPSAAPQRPPAHAAKATSAQAQAPGDATPTGAQPSQANFASAEAPAHAPQVGSTLAEETRLLDAAFAELSAGHWERAKALLEEHQARFPGGLLQRERERARTRLFELTRSE